MRRIWIGLILGPALVVASDLEHTPESWREIRAKAIFCNADIALKVPQALFEDAIAWAAEHNYVCPSVREYEAEQARKQEETGG